MVHDDADRVRLPDQQVGPLTERDIEPLWTPDQFPADAGPAWQPSVGLQWAPPPPPPPPPPPEPDGNVQRAGGARGSMESPWAYPPQRPSGPTTDRHPRRVTTEEQARHLTTEDQPSGPAVDPPSPAPPVAPRQQPAHDTGQGWYSPPPPVDPDPADGQRHPAGWAPLPPDPVAARVTAPVSDPFAAQVTAPVSAQVTDPFAVESAPRVFPLSSAGYSDPLWSDGATPTAEDFARRRQARPVDPVATMGVRAVVNRSTLGLVKLPPGRHEQEVKQDVEMVRRNFGGLRQVTVVNPKGGAGKTVAILLLAMTFGQKRGGYVLAWDNNETQGTLGMRAQQDFHSRTVRDMLRDLGQFQGPHGRVGDLSQYVRSQGEGMFDVLASDESATGGEMLTASAFAEIRDVVSRFYKLIFVDTGNNVRAQNWQAAMDATDQLVVTMSARNDSAETAARMLDHLEQSGRQRLVRQAVTVVSMPPSRKEIDLPAIQEHFAARTRAVLLAPYERLIDTGEPIRYGQLSSATRDAWLKIAAAVAEGL
ncbi:chromosome partitioning protein [Micromonospora sp. WMMD882]|uniref:MinD/ParA family ATP-binding protein n=1 Tax=Micromonospora sp. WMMD882 TaxID=3015151 RepID=UPI00248CADB0|nr:chromosome partitioning protein [Micromonospora sp. WMMD882]WBB82454.1 chromosome partitioning protein [Micromonospora sp. WMMD882]